MTYPGTRVTFTHTVGDWTPHTHPNSNPECSVVSPSQYEHIPDKHIRRELQYISTTPNSLLTKFRINGYGSRIVVMLIHDKSNHQKVVDYLASLGLDVGQTSSGWPGMYFNVSIPDGTGNQQSIKLIKAILANNDFHPEDRAKIESIFG
jgi:hypothetical protein